MKAVLLHGYGGVDQLHYEDVPEPVPAPGEVLVRVISTSVNPVDYKIRQGLMKDRMPLQLPAILGRDVAGEVTAVGDGVTRFRVGDKVMGLVNRSYAEFLTASADVLTGIPDGLNPKDAGVLPLVTQTGAQLVESGVKPQSGEVILVTGAAGSVGRTAVFVARQHGATVIAGVRLSQKAEGHLLGAELVVALNGDNEISRLPELDAIADTVGGEIIARLVPKLKNSGRLASVLGKPESAEAQHLDFRQVWAQPDPERLHVLAVQVKEGRLKIPISRRMQLQEIREAHEQAEKGGGKIALFP